MLFFVNRWINFTFFAEVAETMVCFGAGKTSGTVFALLLHGRAQEETERNYLSRWVWSGIQHLVRIVKFCFRNGLWRSLFDYSTFEPKFDCRQGSVESAKTCIHSTYIFKSCKLKADMSINFLLFCPQTQIFISFNSWIFIFLFRLTSVWKTRTENMTSCLISGNSFLLTFV